jgi:hypothetical protein
MGISTNDSKMIVLVTPTGCWKEQINLCKMFMDRQTYTGPVTWIIVDDCTPRTTDAINRNGWTVLKIYPHPPYGGVNTQARNMIAGFNCIDANFKPEDIEAIFIIEDDDYYKPQYLERMMARFDSYKVLGEMNTVYYNVLYRTYFVNRNTSHSSLFQIAIRPEMMPLFRSCFTEKFIDFKFYEKLHAQEYVRRGEVGFFNEDNLAVGMKGIPGRAGIGAGHGKLLNMLPDPGLHYLNKILLNGDSKYYEGYYLNRRSAQHPLLAGRRR